MKDSDQTERPLFSDCGTLSLEEGFLAYECSKDRFGDWRLLTFSEVCRQELRANGFHIFTAFNVWSYARFRLHFRRAPLEAMRDQFERELSVGLIEAVGYLLPRSETAKPVLIPRQVWEHGDLDWDRAEVTGAGFSFAGIRILMPLSSALLKSGSYYVLPLPELAIFQPSESRRESLGIPAETLSSDDVGQSGVRRNKGRPTLKDEIIRAYHEIEKNPGWSRKELANAIRQNVQEHLGISDDHGLSEDTILGHVRALWDEFRNRKN
jgi:hypothetical protein